MNDISPKLHPPDVSLYPINRAKFPLEELIKFAGQYLAWSPDGTQILAHGPDEESVERELESMGIDPSQVVVSYEDRLERDLAQ